MVAPNTHRKRGLLALIALSCGAAVFVSWPDKAQAVTLQDRQTLAEASLTLMADSRAQPRMPVRALLRVDLKPGWKFYWRYPGEAGLAPNFDWSASENLKAAKVEWPAPKRMAIGGVGFDSFVYERMVMLPILVTARREDRPVHLQLRLQYGLCSTICVPKDTRFALHQVGALRIDQEQEWLEFGAAYAALPQAFRLAGFGPVRAQVDLSRLGLIISLPQHPSLGDADWIASPHEGQDWFAAFGRPNNLGALRGQQRFFLPISGAVPGDGRAFLAGLRGHALRLTLLHGQGAAEGLVTPAP